VKVKSILVSQPKPESDKSPYSDLAEKHKLTIDFRPFIEVQGVEVQEFRNERIDILKHTAVIFTSKNAVDHFFRICTEGRITVPDAMKYFCVNEATAYYLQKYVVYRKRKIFHGGLRFPDLLPLLKKNKDEKFLLPTSDQLKPSIPKALGDAGIKYTRAILYRTVCADLSDLESVKYDMLVFFSPSGIKSLVQNFPDFEQGNTRIAAFGPITHKEVEVHNLRCDIPAPTKEAPSMTMAIEQYIKKVNKK